MKSSLMIYLMIFYFIIKVSYVDALDIQTEVEYPTDTTELEDQQNSVGIYVSCKNCSEFPTVKFRLILSVYKNGNPWGNGSAYGLDGEVPNDGTRKLFIFPNIQPFVSKTDSFYLQVYSSINSPNGEVNYSTFTTRTIYPKITKPLPVTLVYFEVKEQNSKAILTWRTAMEKNTSYFQVEQSTDGIQFKYLGKVSATGTTNEPTDYKFIDYNLNSQKHKYYRLKAIDYDQTYSYSNIISLKINNEPASVSYLQINNQMVQLNHNHKDALKSIVLYSLKGYMLYKSVLLGTGMTKIDGITDKVVIINLVTDKKVYSKKLVIY